MWEKNKEIILYYLNIFLSSKFGCARIYLICSTFLIDCHKFVGDNDLNLLKHRLEDRTDISSGRSFRLFNGHVQVLNGINSSSCCDVKILKL